MTATWALTMASQQKGGGNVNFVRFMLKAQEDFNNMISEISAAESAEYLIEMDGAAHGYLDCISTIVSVMAGHRLKIDDAFSVAPDYVDPAGIYDVLTDWYDTLEETSDLARARFFNNPPTEKSKTASRPEKQPPVDRGKLLIGLEFCRKQTECCGCPYYNRKHNECENISGDSLSYICYLEEQLKEARNGS